MFLNRFFDNLLFGEKHELKNRELQIGYKPPLLAELDRVKEETEQNKAVKTYQPTNDRSSVSDKLSEPKATINNDTRDTTSNSSRNAPGCKY